MVNTPEPAGLRLSSLGSRRAAHPPLHHPMRFVDKRVDEEA